MSSKRFVVYEKMQMMAEVYYDPYFYDLELSVMSSDATRVRSKIGGKKEKKIDWTLYKGAK